MPITVINMIPNTLSGETQRDSEPNVTVNPANPQQIAASAFTPDPASSGNAPIFVSTDGGATWALNVVLPGGNKTGDTTLRFATNSNVIYAGILRSDVALQMNILRAASFTAPGVWTTLVSRGSEDQPWVEAATASGCAGANNDHVYVGNNDFNAGAATATVDESLDAATAAAPAGFSSVRIESRATSGQDGPPIRAAVHPDGTVYAAFLGWRGAGVGGTITSDVVVVRDDDWGAGATPFRDLVDAGDLNFGVRVAIGVTLPPFASTLGTQRTGASVCIAVDPRDSQTVYVAWIDGATGAAAAVHVRRSIDGGQNWSADLRTIATATNPCLAITIRGKVGFLYQQLGNPGTGNRWRTHLEVSSDGFATAPTDLLLADVPDNSGTYAGTNSIGDYANLVALGKNLYAAFSANNTPNNANFPNGVTYQRNANFGTNTLLAADNVTAVAASIDPFFALFTDVTTGDDFYVRDWTDSAVSGDAGLEPSTHPVFYHTSDVWNRRGTLPGAFPNDQPSNEDAGNGAGTTGDNWAFARIRRNAVGAGNTTVTAHFLVSKLGTGSNYVDAGVVDPDVSFPDPDPTVLFNAADLGPLTTIAYHWHLEAVASTHLCLAVEISSPSDPFVAPSLVGRAPGWPTTDLAVINDNNKAQRNMGLSTTPARGAGLRDDLYAIVHNAATFVRNVHIRIDVSPESYRRLRGAQAHVLGDRRRAFKPGTILVLPQMQPGENRWVGLSYLPPAGKPGEEVVAYFSEMIGETAINGFGIGARIGTDTQVLRAVLERQRSVCTRLAAGFNVRKAKALADGASELAKGKRLTPAVYLAYLRSRIDALNDVVAELLKGEQAHDPFDVTRAAEALGAALARGPWEDVVVAHGGFLNRVDSFLTMRQLEHGDPADVLQNVSWQVDLFRRSPTLRALAVAPEVLARSRSFIRAFRERKENYKAFPSLVEALLPSFRAIVAALEKPELRKFVDAIALSVDDVARTQRAHRELLLALESVAGRTPSPPPRKRGRISRSR